MELRLIVPVDQARQLIASALTEQGFTVSVQPNGSLDVSRGSLGTTLVAGSLAGQDMHVRFDVHLHPTERGTVAQLQSSALSGFLKGGAIGATKSGDVVQDAAHRLGTRLAAQGVLESAPVLVGAEQDAAASGAPVGQPFPHAPVGAIPPPIDYQNRTNVVAIVALILGFLFPLGGIIAGAVALAQVKRTREKGRGLAIAGIIVGAVVLVLEIIGIIALIALGVAAEQRDTALETPVFPSPSDPGQVDPSQIDPSPVDPDATPGDEPGSVDVFALAVGDCLNDAGADTVTSVEVIDCAQPHDYEVFTEFTLTGDAFPGMDQIDTLAEDGCLDAFPAFAGIAYADSTLDFSYFAPTEESWSTGNDRLVSCLIIDPEVQTTGSLANAAR